MGGGINYSRWGRGLPLLLWMCVCVGGVMLDALHSPHLTPSGESLTTVVVHLNTFYCTQCESMRSVLYNYFTGQSYRKSIFIMFYRLILQEIYYYTNQTYRISIFYFIIISQINPLQDVSYITILQINPLGNKFFKIILQINLVGILISIIILQINPLCD